MVSLFHKLIPLSQLRARPRTTVNRNILLNQRSIGESHFLPAPYDVNTFASRIIVKASGSSFTGTLDE
jgi:hypothetical protein